MEDGGAPNIADHLTQNQVTRITGGFRAEVGQEGPLGSGSRATTIAAPGNRVRDAA